MRFAENPPKKYEDIVNVDFYADGERAGTVAGAARRGPVLDRAGRQAFPRRQSAHQAAAVLAMADRRHPRPLSGCDFSLGGVHATEDDVSAGEDRLLAVLHLFHLAQHQAGAHRVSDRADDRAGRRLFPSALLRQYARHQPDLPAALRARGISDSRGAGGDAVGPVGNVFRFRIMRGGAAAGPRGISRFRKIPDQAPRLPARPATSSPRSPRSTASARRILRCKPISGLRSTMPSTIRSCSTARRCRLIAT